MSNIGCLFWVINLFMKLSVKYKQICSEPDRKASTSYFGIYAIAMSIFTAGLFVLCVWGITALFTIMDTSGLGEILIIVFIAILALCALVLFVELILGGIMGVVYQFRCNRNPIGYVALAVVILAIVGMALGTVFVLGLMN